MKQRYGFTLVELSIVLVILGLLVGGVLTGQSLIRAAELRSVSTQYQRYLSAVETFKDKYFAIPGDMTNAQTYWGVQNATPATCINSASSDPKTCNGNGNGELDENNGEPFRFWQHLANAGLIEGQYDGIHHGANPWATTTLDAPSGRISGTLWLGFWYGPLVGTDYMFDGDYGNVLEFGAQYTDWDPIGPALTPADAYNIDMKLDDGKPATGKVVMQIVNGSGFNHCSDTASSSNMQANYNLTNTAITCGLSFRQQF